MSISSPLATPHPSLTYISRTLTPHVVERSLLSAKGRLAPPRSKGTAIHRSMPRSRAKALCTEVGPEVDTQPPAKAECSTIPETSCCESLWSVNKRASHPYFHCSPLSLHTISRSRTARSTNFGIVAKFDLLAFPRCYL